MKIKKNKIISYKRFKNRMLKLRANDPKMVEFYRVCLSDPELRAYVDKRGILRLVYKYWGCCNVCAI